jgi:hypothetical protein
MAYTAAHELPVDFLGCSVLCRFFGGIGSFRAEIEANSTHYK